MQGNYKELKTTACMSTGAPSVALAVKNLPANANAGDGRNTSSIPASRRYPGEGHGNPLQYSCLENSMDRGAWWVTVHRVAKSQTRLKLLSTQHAWTIRYKKTKTSQLPLLKKQKHRQGVGSKTRVLHMPPAFVTARGAVGHLSYLSDSTLDTQLPSPHISTQLTPLLGKWAR